MKLLCSHTSPYARAVRIVAAEKQLEIEEVLTSPLESPEWLVKANPLSKVPALLLEGGETLFDSRVICEYLDDVGDGASLLPAAGSARWVDLRLQAIANGLMDAAVASVFEKNRSDAEQSEYWLGRWRDAIQRSVAVMAEEIATLQGVSLGSIACATALGYLDFRHAALNWREQSAELAKWYETMASRPSFIATAPPA